VPAGTSPRAIPERAKREPEGWQERRARSALSLLASLRRSIQWQQQQQLLLHQLPLLPTSGKGRLRVQRRSARLVGHPWGALRESPQTAVPMTL
jgi:hypothetical protein